MMPTWASRRRKAHGEGPLVPAPISPAYFSCRCAPWALPAAVTLLGEWLQSGLSTHSHQEVGNLDSVEILGKKGKGFNNTLLLGETWEKLIFQVFVSGSVFSLKSEVV